MIIFHWPLIQKICLKNLLVLRSKAVGFFADETTEKVETEAGSKKKLKVRLGVEHQVIREFVIF